MTEIEEFIMECYLADYKGGRTSREIADDLKDSWSFTTNEISEYMKSHGFALTSDDGRLIWNRKKQNI